MFLELAKYCAFLQKKPLHKNKKRKISTREISQEELENKYPGMDKKIVSIGCPEEIEVNDSGTKKIGRKFIDNLGNIIYRFSIERRAAKLTLHINQAH